MAGPVTDYPNFNWTNEKPWSFFDCGFFYIWAMAKKKKVWKSPANDSAFRSKEDKIRQMLCDIVNGNSRLLGRPADLYDSIADAIDDIEKYGENPKLQLELLAWTLRCDFICSRVDDDEPELWEGLFYDAGTFFVEIAKDYPDKQYVSDLVHDLAVRHVGEEGRSFVFLSASEFLSNEQIKALLNELMAVVDGNDLPNRDDVLDAISDMADDINDAADYAKAALMRDPQKSNATLIDIANSYFVSGDIEMAKQWLSDVDRPSGEDEEAYMDLQAGIADREGRKSDCIKIAENLYEKYPKVINLARLCQIVDGTRAKVLLEDHIRYRNGGTGSLEFMQLLQGMKCYDLLESYVTTFEKELPGMDAETLKELSDNLEKENQKDLAEHIRKWTVEEPEEAEAFDERE